MPLDAQALVGRAQVRPGARRRVVRVRQPGVPGKGEADAALGERAGRDRPRRRAVEFDQRLLLVSQRVDEGWLVDEEHRGAGERGPARAGVLVRHETDAHIVVAHVVVVAGPLVDHDPPDGDFGDDAEEEDPRQSDLRRQNPTRAVVDRDRLERRRGRSQRDPRSDRPAGVAQTQAERPVGSEESDLEVVVVEVVAPFVSLPVAHAEKRRQPVRLDPQGLVGDALVGPQAEGGVVRMGERRVARKAEAHTLCGERVGCERPGRRGVEVDQRILGVAQRVDEGRLVDEQHHPGGHGLRRRRTRDRRERRERERGGAASTRPHTGARTGSALGIAFLDPVVAEGLVALLECTLRQALLGGVLRHELVHALLVGAEGAELRARPDAQCAGP